MPLIRSLLHLLWMAVTVIPWAIFVIIASIFVSSTTMYWMCAGWLRFAVTGGTLIPRGQKGVYKAGGARLAIEAGAPVIPIAVSSAKCWPRKAFIKTPGIVDFSIGKPIPSVGRHPDELMREVEAWIEAEMHRLDPEAYAASGAVLAEPRA